MNSGMKIGAKIAHFATAPVISRSMTNTVTTKITM
jgi:hypothetical protein